MQAPAPPNNRFMLVDVVRGIAILLMIVYHFSWDLTYFGLAAFRIFSNPYWIWFAKFIAGLILLVMGVSQVMARRRGLRTWVFLKRLAIISACAAIVTIGTYLIDPATFIFFGILHHIAVASILLTVAIRLPSWLLFALAVFILAGPQFLSHEIFSPFWLAWTGLSPISWVSVDYVPLFPWLGVPLLGMVIGRGMLQRREKHPYLKWHSTHPLARTVCFAGRYSLPVYMIHQPVLFASLYGLVTLMNF